MGEVLSMLCDHGAPIERVTLGRGCLECANRAVLAVTPDRLKAAAGDVAGVAGVELGERLVGVPASMLAELRVALSTWLGEIDVHRTRIPPPNLLAAEVRLAYVVGKLTRVL